MALCGEPIETSSSPMKSVLARFIVIFAIFAISDCAFMAAIRIGMDSGDSREFIFFNHLKAYVDFWSAIYPILFAITIIIVNHGLAKWTLLLDIAFSAFCGAYYSFMFLPYDFSEELYYYTLLPAIGDNVLLSFVDFLLDVLELVWPFVALALITGSYKSWRWPTFVPRRGPGASGGIEDRAEDVR